MEEGDEDWERAHFRMKGKSEGERHRLGESALYRAIGVGEEDTDWERAHLRVEGNSRERFRLGESALDRVGMVWGRKTPTGRERT